MVPFASTSLRQKRPGTFTAAREKSGARSPTFKVSEEIDIYADCKTPPGPVQQPKSRVNHGR